MDSQNQEIRRLILWNRFWLVVVTIYTLVAGLNYLWSYVDKDVMRLQVSNTDRRTLIFSSIAGGPFVITHLAYGGIGQDIAVANMAALPHPLMIRSGAEGGATATNSVDGNQLAHLTWRNRAGERVRAPKAEEPVTALYYTLSQVTAPH